MDKNLEKSISILKSELSFISDMQGRLSARKDEIRAKINAICTCDVYNTLKGKYPEALIMFRCGDFYEFYNGDAEIVSKVLGIVLNEGGEVIEHCCGFPHPALDGYLPKLIRAGYRVAITDEVKANF